MAKILHLLLGIWLIVACCGEFPNFQLKNINVEIFWSSFIICVIVFPSALQFIKTAQLKMERW